MTGMRMEQKVKTFADTFVPVSYTHLIRLDLDYLLLSFDGGMKAINPVETGEKRYPVIRPRVSRDFALHFAVGYPF